MTNTTYKSAIVLMPSKEIWEPIQKIRKKHDDRFHRWMPHINLVYPFVEKEDFPWAREALVSACKDLVPFHMEFMEFQYFNHRKNRYVLWLKPTPTESLLNLQKKIQSVLPNDFHRRKFTPHMTVAQKIEGKEPLLNLKKELEDGFKPLQCKAEKISVIWRNDPPDDQFKVEFEVDFAKNS